MKTNLRRPLQEVKKQQYSFSSILENQLAFKQSLWCVFLKSGNRLLMFFKGFNCFHLVEANSLIEGSSWARFADELKNVER